jgi:hypothetical protein
MRRSLSWLCLLGVGCGVSFPEEYRIEDLRILEIRAEPPEIRIFQDAPIDLEVNQLATQPLDLRPVQLSALIAHPDLDATFDGQWIRCKVADDDTGEVGSGFQRVPCDGVGRVELGRGLNLELSPVQLLLEDVLANGGDPVAVITSLAEDPRDLFAGLYANLNLQAFATNASIPVDTPSIEGTKRVVIYDPAVVSLVLREARRLGPDAIPMISGVATPSLCTRASADQLGAINAFLESRIPNRAPRYAGIELRYQTDTATQAYDPTAGPIVLPPGTKVELRGYVAEEDLESYRVIDDNCNLLQQQETMAFSWFTTAGELSPQVTAQSLNQADSQRRVMTYEAPESVEGAEQRVRIWSVLRDGRGGSDAKVIDVLVRP